MGWPDGAGLGCVGVVGGREGRVGSDIGMGLVRSTVGTAFGFIPRSRAPSPELTAP